VNVKFSIKLFENWRYVL